MSKKSGYLLGILLTIIICTILAWIFCCGANAKGISSDRQPQTTPDNVNTVETSETPTSMGFTLRGPDGNFAINSNDNFNFNTSEFDILTPVSSSINEGIGSLKSYLEEEGNRNKRIDITGYYDSDEQNTSAFENLGLARATSVKNYFVSQGIPSARMNTFGELRDALVPDNSIYKGPVAFRLFALAPSDREATQAEMAQVAAAINDDPLILYFNYSESSVTLDEEQRLKIGDITRYLDKVAGATITVEGHTDNQGSNTTNNRLGLDRAEFAKAYLVNNGIPVAKIKTVSKGETNPIASNDTEAGRAKNRRAVITIN